MQSAIHKSLLPLAMVCLNCLAVCAVGQQNYGTYIATPAAQGRQTVSPYLQLLNQGTNTDGSQRSYAVYQTLVRPQLEQRVGEAAGPTLPPLAPRPAAEHGPSRVQAPYQLGPRRTGHGAAFMSYSHYFTLPQPR